MLLLVPVVALLALGGVALFRARPAAELGRAAPIIDLPTLDRPNERVRLGDLRGKPAVLNFWASWCAPCRDEAPELARVARELRSDVTFLGINILDGRREAGEYAQEFRLPYDSVRDARGVVAKRYGVTGVPETVFIDAGGNVVGRYIGALQRGQLEPIVRLLISLDPGELLEIRGRGETRPVP